MKSEPPVDDATQPRPVETVKAGVLSYAAADHSWKPHRWLVYALICCLVGLVPFIVFWLNLDRQYQHVVVVRLLGGMSLAGIGAVWCAIAGLRQPRRSQLSKRRLLMACLAAGLAFLLTAAFVVCTRTTHHPPGTKCMSQLRVIGAAVKMYADDHNGWYPDRLPDLCPKYILAGDLFCPNDPARQSGQPGSSYVYLGQGLRKPVAVTTIIAYELPTSHPGGMNVAYGDGSVVWCQGAAMQKALQQIKATTRPAGN